MGFLIYAWDSLFMHGIWDLDLDLSVWVYAWDSFIWATMSAQDMNVVHHAMPPSVGTQSRYTLKPHPQCSMQPHLGPINAPGS